MTGCGCRRYSFFQPVLRLADKTVLTTPNGEQRFRCTYGPVQTPFQQLCATNALSQEQRQRLEQLRN